MMHVSVMDIQMCHQARRGECGNPVMHGAWGWRHSLSFFSASGKNTATKDEWRTTYLICGERRSIYLSQTWGPARRRAADGWGSGRIWTGTGRRAPWPRSGCCSSAGVSLQGTGEEAVRCSQSMSVREMGYTLGVFTGGETGRQIVRPRCDVGRSVDWKKFLGNNGWKGLVAFWDQCDFAWPINSRINYSVLDY